MRAGPLPVIPPYLYHTQMHGSSNDSPALPLPGTTTDIIHSVTADPTEGCMPRPTEGCMPWLLVMSLCLSQGRQEWELRQGMSA